MKKIILTTLAASALMSVPAVADPVAMFNWTGFYTGVEAGGGWGEARRSVIGGGVQNSYDTSGSTVGGLMGYNWQSGNSVIGIEGRYAGSGIKGNDNNVGLTLDTTKLRSIGSIVGRLGMTQGNVLYFANAGWAFADARHTNSGPPVQSFNRDLDSGWTIGGGVEWAFTQNWTFRVDYRHYNFGRYTITNDIGISDYRVDNTMNAVTAALSYKW